MLPPPLEIWITDSTDWRVGILVLRIYVSRMDINTFTNLLIALNTHLIDPIRDNRENLRINDVMAAVQDLFPFDEMVNLAHDLRGDHYNHVYAILHTIQLPQITVARFVNGRIVEIHPQDEVSLNYVNELFPLN